MMFPGLSSWRHLIQSRTARRASQSRRSRRLPHRFSLERLENRRLLAGLYWVATGDGDWNDTANWALTSGGSGGSAVPGAADTATFDAGGLGNASLICPRQHWRNDDFSRLCSGEITQQPGSTVTVGSSGFTQAGGTFTGGDSAITFNGSFNQSDGIFTATSGTTSALGHDLIFSGGTFNHNNGVMALTAGFQLFDVSTPVSFFDMLVSSADLRLLDTGLSVEGTLTQQSGNMRGGSIDALGDVVYSSTTAGTNSTHVRMVGSGVQTGTINTGATATMLTIDNPQAVVSALGTATVGGPFTLTRGALAVLDGTLTFNAAFTQTGGETALDGGALAASALNIEGGILTGSNGSNIFANVSNVGGTIIPGLGSGVTGILGVQNDYTQGESAVLDIEIGGLTAGIQYDQLDVNEAALAGQLNVSLTSGFSPAAGDTFTILNTDGISGTFLGLPEGAILTAGTRQFQITYAGGTGNNDVVLTSIDIEVQIDIKPGSDSNSINLGSKATIPVAILSTQAFDATTIDPTTVTLADAQVRVRGSGKLLASMEDVNGDGLLDLVVHVETEGLQLTETDTQAELSGMTFDGVSFVGSDAIRVVAALHVAGGPAEGGTIAEELTAATLSPVIEQSLAYWAAAGVEPQRLDALRQVDVRIADLSDSLLGLATLDAVWIDRDAAGYGWSTQAGGVDLLSAVNHEFGHVLGLAHRDDQNVMGATLGAAPRQFVSSSFPTALNSDDDSGSHNRFETSVRRQRARDAVFSRLAQSDARPRDDSVPFRRLHAVATDGALAELADLTRFARRSRPR